METSGTPGTIQSLEQGCMQIQTGQGLLTVLEAQLEGHRRMSSEELVRGVSIRVGNRAGH